MATQHAMDEADIRRRVNELVEAIRAMDLESVTSICAPNLVSYDVGRRRHRGYQREGGRVVLHGRDRAVIFCLDRS